eukprot:4026082-Prymnesium_polylepis.1
MLMCGTLVYYIETRTTANTPFTTIPESIFWASKALSGNYPFFPASDAGKLVSTTMDFIGIGLYALPAGIISSGFIAAPEDTVRRGTASDETMRSSIDPNIDEHDGTPSLREKSVASTYMHQDDSGLEALVLQQVLRLYARSGPNSHSLLRRWWRNGSSG